MTNNKHDFLTIDNNFSTLYVYIKSKTGK